LYQTFHPQIKDFYFISSPKFMEWSGVMKKNCHVSALQAKLLTGDGDVSE
jgi:hypothetical protein